MILGIGIDIVSNLAIQPGYNIDIDILGPPLYLVLAAGPASQGGDPGWLPRLAGQASQLSRKKIPVWPGCQARKARCWLLAAGPAAGCRAGHFFDKNNIEKKC